MTLLVAVLVTVDAMLAGVGLLRLAGRAYLAQRPGLGRGLVLGAVALATATPCLIFLGGVR